MSDAFPLDPTVGRSGTAAVSGIEWRVYAEVPIGTVRAPSMQAAQKVAQTTYPQAVVLRVQSRASCELDADAARIAVRHRRLGLRMEPGQEVKAEGKHWSPPPRSPLGSARATVRQATGRRPGPSGAKGSSARSE